MSVKYNLPYDAESVFELLTDPDFLVQRSLECGELSADAEVEEDGIKTHVIMNREVVRELPKVLAKIFDPKQTLHMKESWQQVGSNFVGKSEFTIEGQPASLSADMTIKPTNSGCEYAITYKAKANIPLVGGKVEKFIIANCEDAIPKEVAFLEEKLAG
ncbi:Uncharacterised protein [BD1-7 clade bacterium]|uniref:DUF2505 domain-containing protein n=1 Tax=BD1-7 clade bacterium TaxID=2029982 RepID=A0A5S9PL11_9GAMM|nr:Uncharacterised protein [BD1-7 clade bacterium]CAA0104630.1 Uncharacterised protein [BD1-7 clade bacterium]